MDATATHIRQAGRAALRQALLASRADTLAAFAAYESALPPGLQVPCTPELNPPLWELGHVGWFQDWFVARNSQRHLGCDAQPLAPRTPARRADADALYDSGQVPHDSRWALPLPDARAIRADLAEGLATSLELLDEADDDDRGLYFHRLALFHEDMHFEAALYMAQTLGLDLPQLQTPRPALPPRRQELHVERAIARIGWAGTGFAFDNELLSTSIDLQPFNIDSRVISWNDYIPFISAGGYADARWWQGPAAAWRAAQSTPPQHPRHLRPEGRGWLQRRGSRWEPLDLQAPACHLTAHEAQAWCAWAGRRLPTEAEWEHAALQHPQDFYWGAVWEWTASPFEPYPGFKPHPYQDYSAPWFGRRRVLRGGSFATQERVRQPRYRNFYPPERSDIFAGFRSCAP